MTEEHTTSLCNRVLFLIQPSFNRQFKSEDDMTSWKTPADCRYAKSDEWIRVEGGEGVVGLTDYAQSQLSDLVFIELPKVGASYEAGKPFGVVESVKAASDLNLPVAGEIIAVNNALESAPETMNSDPFGEGWIVRIKIANPSELDGLMDAAAYTAYCEQRA
jgi:glycine cleavage system H protein